MSDEFLIIGEMVFCDGITGVISDVEFDEEGKLIGFSLRDGARTHRYNLDMMMDDARALILN